MKKYSASAAVVLFVLALSFAASASAKRWVYLGNAHVDKSADHKTIHVNGSGQFHTIQLRVNGGGVEFERLVVHFADGTKEELPVQDHVSSGGKTHELDLPGDRRAINSVELWYSKEHLNERPEVRLYAAP